MENGMLFEELLTLCRSLSGIGGLCRLFREPWLRVLEGSSLVYKTCKETGRGWMGMYSDEGKSRVEV